MAGSKAKKSKLKREYKKFQSTERFLDRVGVAQLLGVHLETVKRMERDGRLPKPIAFGLRVVRHERAAIEKYLEQARK
jgi:excisionase family DNA binding protein